MSRSARSDASDAEVLAVLADLPENLREQAAHNALTTAASRGRTTGFEGDPYTCDCAVRARGEHQAELLGKVRPLSGECADKLWTRSWGWHWDPIVVAALDEDAPRAATAQDLRNVMNKSRIDAILGALDRGAPVDRSALVSLLTEDHFDAQQTLGLTRRFLDSGVDADSISWHVLERAYTLVPKAVDAVVAARTPVDLHAAPTDTGSPH